MQQFTDQTGYTITLPTAPQRIISLVPSQTELICDLGCHDQLVGVTKFCVWPKSIRETATVVGGTKQVHADRIAALQPDLIIGNKEENTKEMIEGLREQYPVWLSDVRDLPTALRMIEQIGQLLGKHSEGQQLSQSIQKGFGALTQKEKQTQRSVLYVIWHKPLMAAGKDTFIDAMLQAGGFTNVIRQPRYPKVQPEEALALSPDYVFLSSEPFPFKEKHLQDYREKFPNAAVRLVNGELFSWYGSRLRKTAGYLAEISTSTDSAP